MGMYKIRKDRLDGLDPSFRKKLEGVLSALRRRGFKPWVFEGLRTAERQKYLYSIGRRGKRGERPVTWTLQSRHLSGKAADVIDADKLWATDESFWDALADEAKRAGLDAGHLWSKRDSPHLQMN
jgi:hypothetical protein